MIMVGVMVLMITAEVVPVTVQVAVVGVVEVAGTTKQKEE
jgi:hypothetical protein